MAERPIYFPRRRVLPSLALNPWLTVPAADTEQPVGLQSPILNPWLTPKPQPVRRKVFVSYHHADEVEVASFIAHFNPAGATFITRGLGAGMSEDIISSTNTDYIMGRIRREYLGDSTVTIVLMGKCTWGRRYVDWEIQASLRQGDIYIPNGLFGVKLPSFKAGNYPERLNRNLRWPGDQDCFARVYDYPSNSEALRSWIEDAYSARTIRARLIRNVRERFANNKRCCDSHYASLTKNASTWPARLDNPFLR